jgi:peptide-methionine (S)-S-oxide reductase
VIRTRVGYAGGTTANPTYYNLDGHSETVEIDYDPTIITYGELLEIFWRSHDPTIVSFSKQYKSIIFYHNDEQKMLAMESKELEESRRGKKIQTDIVAFSAFYLAEDYHQKYYLQQNGEIMHELKAIYGNKGDFFNSTVAARINGLLGGNGTLESLREQVNTFGLSAAAQQRLLKVLGGSGPLARAGICPL